MHFAIATMAGMKPSDRHSWIYQEVTRERFVDVLNRDFVDDYVEHTGASIIRACGVMEN